MADENNEPKNESPDVKDVKTDEILQEKKETTVKADVQEEHKHEKHEIHHAHHHKVEHEHKKDNKTTIYTIVIVLGVILLGFLLWNIFQGMNATTKLNDKIKDAKADIAELEKPVEITLYLVKNSKCTNCVDLSSFVSAIKTEKVKIVKEELVEYDSENGKKLIEVYDIKKIPTVIIIGNLSKFESLKSAFDVKKDAFVLTRISPPYTDANNGDVKGLINSVIVSDKECKECIDFQPIVQQIRSNGVFLDTEKTVDVLSDEGKELVKKYNLSKVPSLIFSKEAGDYELIKQSWPQIGRIAADGSYLLEEVSPPYKDLATGKIVGLVEVTYLTDKSCDKCYDVAQHKAILANPKGFNVNFAKETTYDISDAKGKELVAKYNITAVPTVILSKEVSTYKSLVPVWKTVGSIESDGSFIFRNVGVIGAYKDLAKNEVIAQTQQEQ